ncbi:MAG: hypothetical protein ACP5HU_10260 [Phycisphaerae bacterium]
MSESRQAQPSAPQRNAACHKAGDPSGAESAWSRRYREALQRYEGLDFGSQEAIAAVIEGLAEWARLLPQRSVDADGRPEPANKWGLGPERCMLRAINSHLVTIGQSMLAARVRSELSDLMQTAKSLDKCARRPVVNAIAERRLVATARMQTKALRKLLLAVQAEVNRRDGSRQGPRRKRGAPRRANPLEDRRLMEQWAQVRGKAGMTRKEFCKLKGITLQAFIRAQDRHRKQRALAATDTDA